MRSFESKRVVLGVIGILAGVASVCTAQQSTTIRIRFANGRTGKPLHLKPYDHGSTTTSYKDYKVDRVEGDGLIVTFNNVNDFAFRSEIFNSCDTPDKNAAQPRYNLQAIMATGLVSPNYCGHLPPATPHPGELLIYSRHEHWWQVTGRVAKGLLICA